MDYIKRAKDFRTKKSLGQNFLVDEKIINKILEEASVNSDDTVVEIGAGAGFVTEKLVQKAGKVIAVELDEKAVNLLQKMQCDNLKVIHQDILKTDFSQIIDSPVKIVANIPYYITSPIIAHLLGEIDEKNNKNRPLVKEIFLMVQYEVAKRIVASEKSPSKEYGLLSILVNYWCETQFLCKVPASCFFPAPKVDSALLKLTVREKPIVELENPALFRKVVKAAFGTRRKTLKNALQGGGFSEEVILKALEKSGISPQQRGEKLSIAEFKTLTDNMFLQ